MLYFVKIRVVIDAIEANQLWDKWEEEAEAALGAIAAGTIVSAYKIVGQRRVVAIVDVASHDQLDHILMAALPMAHHLEIEEIVPVREYEKFAADVKRRWQ